MSIETCATYHQPFHSLHERMYVIASISEWWKVAVLGENFPTLQRKKGAQRILRHMKFQSQNKIFSKNIKAIGMVRFANEIYDFSCVAIKVSFYVDSQCAIPQAPWHEHFFHTSHSFGAVTSDENLYFAMTTFCYDKKSCIEAVGTNNAFSFVTRLALKRNGTCKMSY